MEQTNNYNVLNSWVDYSDNDHVIADYLRKKILKESNSTLAFYAIALLTSVMFLIFEAMVEVNWIWTVVFIVVSIIFISLILDLLTMNRKRKKQIDSRDFKTCEIEAFDISDKYNEKYCMIKDKEGHALPNPVAYYSYFSIKENDGVLVVLPKIAKNQNDFVIVFPKSYLSMEKNDRRSIKK